MQPRLTESNPAASNGSCLETAGDGIIQTGPVFARWAQRFASLVEDEAFWKQRDAALAKLQSDEAAERKRQHDQLKQRRLDSLPVLYRSAFDPKRATYPKEVVQRVRDWQPGPQGIGLVGRTGLGKTRLLAARLRLLTCSWLYLPAARLSDLVAEVWSQNYRISDEARSTLADARRVRVLMLDDIGDEKTTDAVSEELKDLIETRTSRQLPILWTSNLSEHEMEIRHGTRGASIVRRLAEFSWTP